MHNVLVDGGTIRKLWIGEAAKYRDHLLRLDPESRRNRFGGAVSDEFIENFVELTLGLDAVIHGFCTTCHNTPEVGNHSFKRLMNTGVSDPFLANNPLAGNIAGFPKYVIGPKLSRCAISTVSSIVITSDTAIPTQGVLKRGCVHANARGRPPSRPMANNVRAVRFTPARAAMKPLAATLRSMITESQFPT
jgi:hypothetical protein